MVKISIQTKGNDLIVGLEGESEQEITEQYYSFYNLKSTSGELHWLKTSGLMFGFFYSTVEAFDKWIIDSSVRIYGNSVKSIKSVKEAQRKIEKLIKERREEISGGIWLRYSPPSDVCYAFPKFEGMVNCA